MALSVRSIDRTQALAYLSGSSGVTYHQAPAWASVRPGWDSALVGWFDETGAMCGYGLVLRRGVRRVPRHLAYLDEGPALAWTERPVEEWLAPLVAHLRASGAFAVKISPRVVRRVWQAKTIKDAVRARTAEKLGGLTPDEEPADGAALATALRQAGWQQQLGADHLGISDHAFELPLAGRAVEELLASVSQQWRRNIKKAQQAGVEIVRGGVEDLPEFHRTYVETANRSGFEPEELDFFTRMATGLGAEGPDRFQLYLARHDGEVLGAAIDVRVGSYVGYGYGGSSSQRREVQPNTLLHWRAIGDAVRSGAAVYDMRGIDDTLDPDDPKFGMLNFKLGTNGRAVEYVGEWDLPLNRPLYAAMQAYRRLRRR